jgi:hypothetical protein
MRVLDDDNFNDPKYKASCVLHVLKLLEAIDETIYQSAIQAYFLFSLFSSFLYMHALYCRASVNVIKYDLYSALCLFCYYFLAYKGLSHEMNLAFNEMHGKF